MTYDPQLQHLKSLSQLVRTSTPKPSSLTVDTTNNTFNCPPNTNNPQLRNAALFATRRIAGHLSTQGKNVRSESGDLKRSSINALINMLRSILLSMTGPTTMMNLSPSTTH